MWHIGKRGAFGLANTLRVILLIPVYYESDLLHFFPVVEVAYQI